MTENVLVSVLEKQRLEFSHLGPSATESVILRPHITVINYNWVQLIVRVHARNLSSGQFVRLRLFNTLPSTEDSREFSETTDFAYVDVTPSAPTSVPGLVNVVGSNPQAYLKFVALANQGSVGGTALYVELSAALLLRKT